MKFVVVTLIFLKSITADVSHLNNVYLPPVISSLTEKHHYHHFQENQKIPQSSVQEVVDNSVVENYTAQEQKAPNFGGQVVRDSSHLNNAINDHIQTSGVLAQRVQNNVNFVHQAKAQFQQSVKEPVVPTSETYDLGGQPAIKSSHFDGIVNGNIQTAAVAADVAHHVKTHVQHAVASVKETVEPVAAVSEAHIINGQHVVNGEHFADSIKGQLDTTGVLAQHIQNAAALVHQAKTHVHRPVAVSAEKPASPGFEVYQSTQQQTDYHTQISQQHEQEKKQEEPEQSQYYTDAIAQTKNEMNVAVPQQEHHQLQYNVAISAPAVDQYSQQQRTGYYGQQLFAVDSTAAPNVDTQYANNGGYVY